MENPIQYCDAFPIFLSDWIHVEEILSRDLYDDVIYDFTLTRYFEEML